MEGKIRERERERESYDRKVCHRITCKIYERKKCIHGSKERFKEQYSNILLPTLTYGSDLDMEEGIAIKSVYCGNDLFI